MFKLRALKAKHGDSLLLIAGADDSRKTKVLIDGGPSGVYDDVLRSQLEQLQKIDPQSEDPPLIDLMMVSHIDDDHINGILKLTDDLLEARQEKREPIVHIRQAWHNSFSDFILKDEQLDSKMTKSSMGVVASTFKDMILEKVKADTHIEHSEMVLASVRQGRNLRINLNALDIKSNSRFKDNLIVVPENMKSRTRNLNKTLQMKIIGPHQDELDALREKWKKELPKILKKDKRGITAAMSGLDTSVANLASLVIIAEHEGKSILLTGDARGDLILKSLKRAGLTQSDTWHFDVLKLPHHGSDRNVSQKFFESVTADHYIISGDGGHGNPEPRMFEWLFKARKKVRSDEDYTIHMTYSFEELEKDTSYKKHENKAKLDKIMDTLKPRAVFKTPKRGQKYLDIDLMQS